MTLSAPAIEEACRLLMAARGDHRRIDGLPEQCRPATAAEGYAIQDALIDALDAPRAGYNIGCTSRRACELLGADGPFSGVVLASTVLESPADAPASAFHRPGLEPEFAFRLAADLSPAGGPYRREDMAAAIDCLIPAIEIVDSRFNDWGRVGVPSIIADNAANAALVDGTPVTGWASTDLERQEVSIAVDGAEAARGTGAAVMGHPFEALAWLTNHLCARSDGLKAGDIVSTGTCAGVVDLAAGSVARADFGPFGTVELRLSAD